MLEEEGSGPRHGLWSCSEPKRTAPSRLFLTLQKTRTGNEIRRASVRLESMLPLAARTLAELVGALAR